MNKNKNLLKSLLIPLILAINSCGIPKNSEYKYLYSKNDEKLLGSSKHKILIKKLGVEISDENLKKYVERIKNEILIKSGNKKLIIKTYIFESKTLNSFSSIGGYIYFTTAILYLMTKDELRLARFSLTFSHFDAKGYDRAEEFGWMYMEECPKKSKLIPGTVEVLNYLKGKYTQHIITNGFLEVQGIKQVASGLKSYFDVVVCSEEVGEKKPHPSVFKYALEKAGANGSESVMIGDNLEVDALGAQNAGLTGIWFNPKQKSIPHSVVEIIELEELFHIL